MAVEPGGELAEEVDVGMAVEVHDAAAFAFDERQREGRVEEDRARVAAGHDGLRLGLARGTLGIGRAEALLGLLERRLEAQVDAGLLESGFAQCSISPR